MNKYEQPVIFQQTCDQVPTVFFSLPEYGSFHLNIVPFFNLEEEKYLEKQPQDVY